MYPKKHAYLFLFCCFFAPTGKTQETPVVSPVPEKITFGFCVGGSNFILRLKEADIYHAATGYQDSIRGITARGTLGLLLGFLAELHIDKQFYFRLSPGFMFNDYVVYYSRMNGRTDFMSSQNSFFELPAHIVYKRKSKKWRPVIMAGSSFKVEYTRPKNEFGTTRYWSADIGVAFEKKLGRLWVSPGIRYAYALSDVNISRRIEFPKLIDRMRLSTLNFTLSFRA